MTVLSDDDKYAFTQVFEQLAGMKREVDRLLTLAKRSGTSLDDLEYESIRFHELAASYELALQERGNFDEQD